MQFSGKYSVTFEEEMMPGISTQRSEESQAWLLKVRNGWNGLWFFSQIRSEAVD